MSRRTDKADCAVLAWKAKYGTVISKHAAVLICAVAEGESSCGDAWNHSGNWGAVQRRQMTPAEKALVIAGATPMPKDPFEILIHDSDPVAGKFQAWYWAFPADQIDSNSGLSGDCAGAWRLIKVLLEDAGRATCIKPVIDTVDAYTLARLMYRTGYYGGFHVPTRMYPQPDGTSVSGADLNIRDYTQSITWNMSLFTRDLASWQPEGAQPVDPASPNLGTGLISKI